MNGKVVSIYIGSQAGEDLLPVDDVHALPGQGLEGDRYFLKHGFYSEREGTGRDLTMIESESLENLEAETGIHLEPGEARRNLITRGVRLNDLVGKVFQVGEVTVRGMRLCEPCSHLEGLTHPGVLKGLVQRGGLRVNILNEGTIRVGDAIQTPDAGQL